MKDVTSTEMKNRFGEYLEAARMEPLIIKKTGRRVAVLTSYQDYERLVAIENAYWAEKAKRAEATGYLGEQVSLKFVQEKLSAKT